MLSASVDFSSASSLLTIGVPAAGISGTGTKEEVSFSSILNAGDSAMALPEINVAAPGSVLPEENRIAAQVLSDAREITEETVATSRTLDFYDLSADSDDLSRKLYDVELSDADYELFDPLSREGEEFSAGDLSACLTPCHSEPSAIPVADILAGVRDLFSRRGFPESGLTSDDLGGAESGEMSPSDFGEQTDSETVPEIPEQAVISQIISGFGKFPGIMLSGISTRRIPQQFQGMTCPGCRKLLLGQFPEIPAKSFPGMMFPIIRFWFIRL